MPRRKRNHSKQRTQAVRATELPPPADATETPPADAPRLPFWPINADGPRAWAAALILLISIGVVYVPALDVPFIFDDHSAIIRNTSIRSLWPLVGTTAQPGPLNPASQLPTDGRPLVNFTFAVNYYFGRLSPFDFHLANVVIHFLSALLLWTITRRTLQLPYFAGRFENSAGWLALTVAMIWALHPLQTEAVIYATQRTELMFAFFYLATLYFSLQYWQAYSPSGLVRSVSVSERRAQRVLRGTWLFLAVLACLAGMASKEVMVSAPLMVLLFERTFVAGSLAKAIRRSWPLYVGLISTWILLFAVNIHGPRRDSAGFDLDVSGYAWWLTQTKVLLMYLKLVVWPTPLLIHYQFPYFTTFGEAWMYAIPVLLVGIGTLILLWRNQPVGYLGTFLFAILSPTLVIPIVTEMVAERRMYLPLAALMILVVVGGYWLCQQVMSQWSGGRQRFVGLSLKSLTISLPALFLALVCGTASAKRLAVYADVTKLWQDVLRYYPQDHMAQYNRGHWLAGLGRLTEAVESFDLALTRRPNDVDTLNNLGVTLMRLGRFPEAMEHLKHAIRVQPGAADLHSNLGLVLTRDGQLPAAISELQVALELEPDNINALNNMGVALLLSGRYPEAIEVLERAIGLQPDNAELRDHLGSALARSGKSREAIEQYQRAVELDPNDLEALYNLGLLLPEVGDVNEAISHFEQLIRLKPDVAEFRNSFADLLRKTGRPQEAIEHYQAAVRLHPDFLEANTGLAQALAQADRFEEAIAAAQKANEVARSAGRQDVINQIDEFLKHYRNELERRGAALEKSN